MVAGVSSSGLLSERCSARLPGALGLHGIYLSKLYFGIDSPTSHVAWCCTDGLKRPCQAVVADDVIPSLTAAITSLSRSFPTGSCPDTILRTQEDFTVYDRPARRRFLSQDLQRYETKRSWWPGSGAMENKRVKARTTRRLGVPSPLIPGKSFVFTPCHQHPDIIIANMTMFMLDRVETCIFCFNPSVCQKLPSTTKSEEGTTV